MHTQIHSVSTNSCCLLSRIIYLSKILSEDNGARFYFVFLPQHSRYLIKSYKEAEFKRYLEQELQNKNVINIVNELKIPIININKDLLERYPDPLSLIAFETNNDQIGHFNELGYKLVSKIILKKRIGNASKGIMFILPFRDALSRS